MLAILNSKPIYDKAGRGVLGRFYVMQKDTDQKANIYLYDENNNLIPGSNPVYTDAFGYPEYDVILDDNIYSIVVETYRGNYSDPKQDTRSEMWEITNTYYEGYIKSNDGESEVTYGINSIADADISKQTITVVGYYTPYDCGSRTYVWDETCVLDPDGGYIMGSNQESIGRWILLNDLPWIPSEYYGVYPGKTSNLNRFVSLPSKIETMANTYVLPNALKFAPGEYSLPNNITLANDRNMIVDNETTFGEDFTITCNGVTRFGEKTDKYIGVLKLPATTPAKLSWFPTYDSFFGCGSKILHIDCELSDRKMYSNITLSGCTIYFEGHKANVSFDSESNAGLTLNNCTIVGYENKSVGFGVMVKFQNMFYTDKYIYDEMNNGQLGTGLKFSAGDFSSKIKFVDACVKTGVTDINLEGYTASMVATFDSSVKFRNGKITTINCTGDLTIENMEVVKAVVGGTSNISNSSITQSLESTGKVTATNSTIASVKTSASLVKLNGTTVSALEINNTGASLSAKQSTISNYKTSAINTINIIDSDFVISKDISVMSFSSTGSTVYGLNYSVFNINASRMYFLDSFVSALVNQTGKNTTYDADSIKMEASNTTFYNLITSFTTDLTSCKLLGGVWPKSYEAEWYDGTTIRMIRAHIQHCEFAGDNRGIYLKPQDQNDYNARLISFRISNNSFNQVLKTSDGFAQYGTDGIFVQMYTRYSTAGAAIAQEFLDPDVSNHGYFWQNNSGMCLQTYSIGDTYITGVQEGVLEPALTDLGFRGKRVVQFGTPSDDHANAYEINVMYYYNNGEVVDRRSVDFLNNGIKMRRARPDETQPYLPASDDEMFHRDYFKFTVHTGNWFSRTDKDGLSLINYAYELKPVHESVVM